MNNASKLQGFVEFEASTAPGVAPSGKARQYYDSGSNTLKLSVNTGGYNDVGGVSFPVTVPTTLGAINHFTGPTDQNFIVQSGTGRSLKLLSDTSVDLSTTLSVTSTTITLTAPANQTGAFGVTANFTATSSTFNPVSVTGSYSDGGTNSTTVVKSFKVTPTINYTAGTKTGHYEAIVAEATETSLPTGQSYLYVGRGGGSGTSLRWGVTNEGLMQTDYTIDTSSGDSSVINKPAGRVRKDNTGTTYLVTNSLVTANSLVFAQLITSDTTALFVKRVTPTSGSFTIELNAAPTSDVDINWWVLKTD